MHPDDEWSYLERLSTCESVTASPTTKPLEEPRQVGEPPPGVSSR